MTTKRNQSFFFFRPYRETGLWALCVWSLSVFGLSLSWSLCVQSLYVWSLSVFDVSLGLMSLSVSDVSLFLCRVPLLRILLTNTKVPRSTKLLVAGVKDKLNKVLNSCCFLTLGFMEPPADTLGPALSASIKHGD